VAGGYCRSAIPRTLILKLRDFIQTLETTNIVHFQVSPPASFPINDTLAFPRIAESLFDFQAD